MTVRVIDDGSVEDVCGGGGRAAAAATDGHRSRFNEVWDTSSTERQDVHRLPACLCSQSGPIGGPHRLCGSAGGVRRPSVTAIPPQRLLIKSTEWTFKGRSGRTVNVWALYRKAKCLQRLFAAAAAVCYSRQRSEAEGWGAAPPVHNTRDGGKYETCSVRLRSASEWMKNLHMFKAGHAFTAFEQYIEYSILNTFISNTCVTICNYFFKQKHNIVPIKGGGRSLHRYKYIIYTHPYRYIDR